MSFFGEIKQGDIVGAFKKILGFAENAVTSLEAQFPALGTFVQQFGSDFGQKVLADAEALAPAVIAGTTTITVAAAQLVAQAASQAKSLAISDATTIALNALRVQVTAASPVALTVATTPTPAAVAAAAS